MSAPLAAVAVCSRCGRIDSLGDLWGRRFWAPPGAGESVCPDCECAAWHPRCTSLLDVDGNDRVDETESQRSPFAVFRCGHVDRRITIYDPETESLYAWVCRECDGEQFELVQDGKA